MSARAFDASLYDSSDLGSIPNLAVKSTNEKAVIMRREFGEALEAFK